MQYVMLAIVILFCGASQVTAPEWFHWATFIIGGMVGVYGIITENRRKVKA